MKLRDEVAVVIVTHNLQQAYRIADYVAFMYLGELVEYGDGPDDLRLAARAANKGVRQWCVWLALRAADPRPDGVRDHAAGGGSAAAEQRSSARYPGPAAGGPAKSRRSRSRASRCSPPTAARRSSYGCATCFRHPVSDLPISVGVVAKSGHRVYLNGARDSDYFLSHVPGIPAGGVLTWVFTTGRSLAPSTRPFAAVGVASPPLVSGLRALPRIAISTGAQLARSRARSDPQHRPACRNTACRSTSSRAGWDGSSAPGRATIAHLGAGATAAISSAPSARPSATA